jgi:hypothetical protein
MAAVQPLFCSGYAAAACFGRSAAVANIRAMVKQGGSETAEIDASKESVLSIGTRFSNLYISW